MMYPPPIRILFALFLVALAANGQGNKSQASLEVSGTWLLDRGQSNVGELGKRDAPIKIVYNDPELRITRTLERNGQTIERDFVFYTDGRGETNPALSLLTTDPGRFKTEDLDKELVKSKTTRHGDKIAIRAVRRTSAGTHVMEYETFDEWKVSSDGKTLTQTSRIVLRPDPMSRSIVTQANRPDDKRVYLRVK